MSSVAVSIATRRAARPIATVAASELQPEVLTPLQVASLITETVPGVSPSALLAT